MAGDTNEDDVSLPPLIPKSKSRMLDLYRQMRPYPGAILNPKAKGVASPESKERQALEARKVDTRGLDVSIILVRMLSSYGFRPNLDKPPETAGKFWAFVLLDLGWDRTEDYNLKGNLIRHFCGDKVTSNMLSNNPLRCSSILEKIGFHEKQSQFYHDSWFTRQVDATDGPWQPHVEDQGHSKHILEWDGSKSLEVSIKDTLVTVKEKIVSHFFCLCPKFLHVRYTSAGERHFNIMREISMSVPTIHKDQHNKWHPAQRIVLYRICAVVRMADKDNQDDVRTYWKDGHEIIPAKHGNYREKDMEASKPTRWSVRQAGIYDLFYFLVFQPTAAGDGLDHNAPEYEERDWVQESQPLNPGGASSSAPDSSAIPSRPDTPSPATGRDSSSPPATQEQQLPAVRPLSARPSTEQALPSSIPTSSQSPIPQKADAFEPRKSSAKRPRTDAKPANPSALSQTTKDGVVPRDEEPKAVGRNPSN